MRNLILIALTVSFICLHTRCTMADETDVEKQQIAAALKLTTDAAKNYRFQFNGLESQPCERTRSRVMN